MARKNNGLGGVAAVVFGWFGSNQHPSSMDGYLWNVRFTPVSLHNAAGGGDRQTPSMSMNEESVYPAVRLEKRNFQKEKNLNTLSFSLRIVFLVVSMLPAFAIAGVEVYFLRHAEADNSNPDKPLVAAGQARAEALSEHLAPVQVTHIFVTNYYRNVDTAKPLASSKKLEVVQVPKIGSTVNGKEVTNRSKGVAIEPMLGALNNLSDGSVAVVVANSGNLFPIMSKFGVSQLPCNSKKCFPKKEFNNIWIVTKSADGTNLRTEKYGR